MNNIVHCILDFTVGNLFGKDVTCREPIDPCDRYQPGTIVEFGRTGVLLFKKFLMPGGLCAVAPVIKPQPISPDKPVECSNEMSQKKMIRPSELPIYVHEQKSESRAQNQRDDDKNPQNFLEQGFGTVRKSVQGVMNEYNSVTSSVTNKFSTGIEHSQLMLDYLREETNTLPRVGAVAIGGLTGLIFSLRGGKFKRLVYTTTGAMTVAAVCYPRQAEESLSAAKHYANIAINFAYGVKPGEKQMEIAWPELPKFKAPTSFSDIVNIVSETGTSAANAIGTLAGKTTEAVQEEKKPTEAAAPKNK